MVVGFEFVLGFEFLFDFVLGFVLGRLLYTGRIRMQGASW